MRKLFALFVAAMLAASPVRADGLTVGKRIPDFPAAGALAGSELFLCWQNNSTRSCGLAGLGAWLQSFTVPDRHSCTLTLGFGGASTGITYDPASSCSYLKSGREITLNFLIVLSSKGSATGAAQILGLPFASAFNPGAGVIAWEAGFLSLTGPIIPCIPATATTANLFQIVSGGELQLTDANFTDGTVLGGVLHYFTN